MWIAEGLFFYLRGRTVASILRSAASLTRGRAGFGADTFGMVLLGLPSMKPLVDHRACPGEPLPFCTDEPADLFQRNGWASAEIREPGQIGANFGRIRSLPKQWAGAEISNLRTYLVRGNNPP